MDSESWLVIAILTCILAFCGEPDLHDAAIERLLPSQYDCPATAIYSI